MEADPLEAQVKRLVADQTAVRADQLSADTRLQQDIGVDGQDGWELIEEFGERFGVDLSEFRADLHFGSEGGGVLFSLLSDHRRDRVIPIAISDLVAAAKSGRWHTPDHDPD